MYDLQVNEESSSALEVCGNRENSSDAKPSSELECHDDSSNSDQQHPTNRYPKESTLFENVRY